MTELNVTNNVISILIAIVVFAMVLVPIVGVMSEGETTRVQVNEIGTGTYIEPEQGKSYYLYCYMNPNGGYYHTYEDVNINPNAESWDSGGNVSISENWEIRPGTSGFEYRDGNAESWLECQSPIYVNGDTITLYLVNTGEEVVLTGAKLVTAPERIATYTNSLMVGEDGQSHQSIPYVGDAEFGIYATEYSTGWMEYWGWGDKNGLMGFATDYENIYEINVSATPNIVDDELISITTVVGGQEYTMYLELQDPDNSWAYAYVPIYEYEKADGGTVSTLISIIPVFVAVGLILVIVGMFYDPKKQ